jgi:hypothetical protein
LDELTKEDVIDRTSVIIGDGSYDLARFDA